MRIYRVLRRVYNAGERRGTVKGPMAQQVARSAVKPGMDEERASIETNDMPVQRPSGQRFENHTVNRVIGIPLPGATGFKFQAFSGFG